MAGEGELTPTQPSACSPPSLLAATDYALLTLTSLPFQLSPLWSECLWSDCFTFAHSTPYRHLLKIWTLQVSPSQDLGELRTYPASLEMQPLLGILA